jgi:hypothetical protein
MTLSPVRKGSCRPGQLLQLLPDSPALRPCRGSSTHRVLRPLRPRNMRPCTISSWFPVSISSCTPAAPSKAPSRTSLILLLLRFLEGGDRSQEGGGGPGRELGRGPPQNAGR